MQGVTTLKKTLAGMAKTGTFTAEALILYELWRRQKVKQQIIFDKELLHEVKEVKPPDIPAVFIYPYLH